ncbi:Adenylate cyclase type 2 [Operophtera brumata]|uniref:adenylate cyclase n=1 Tax=Operophtera brumata TaxID=104452 RepID=A0A0L7L6Z9_OPEBR|nr:Adenylate cyclase type 2 [Operophtera brumata]
MALLSIYIFLPMRNNFLAILIGVIVSTFYVLIFAFFTYDNSPNLGTVVASDIIYLIGVNLMGVYFRLMNEIVTRRSFLDRRACVERTFDDEYSPRTYRFEGSTGHTDNVLRSPNTYYESHYEIVQLYVEEHDNVSILYADVVNYTMISTTLSPMRMEHDVLRIKFLGDCYYCVSGIPQPSEQHAKNCVDLGLEMINIIKDVREKRSLNIDMRIGVHSGKILSGLIGIRKWQKVHVTKQTLELLLQYAREYIIEPNFESQNDPFIMKNKLETYLLSRPTRALEYKPFRRASVGFTKIITKNTSNRRSENRNSTHGRRTTTFMDENLVEYQQMLKAADAQMTKEIEDMTNGKFSLMFKNYELEKTFLLLPDPLFKYYITCCLIILFLILMINGLTTNWLEGFQWYTWIIFGFLLLALILLQPFTWFQFLWTKYKGFEEPRDKYLRWIYDISANIIKSAKIRTTLYVLISVGLAATSVVNVIGCTEVEVEPAVAETVLSNCVSSWHVTQCWGLALLLNFLFSRVFFIFKWVVAGGMTVFYLWIVWEIKTSLFAIDTTWNVGLDPRVSHTLSVVFITITLYWIDRTTEYRNRLDHLWQLQLSEEQKEAETMLKVNNMLLENILPAHVVQVYLNLNRSIDELYYEKYDNVAVMFASLTDYKLGVESDADLNDKFMLSILDEVISDFDRNNPYNRAVTVTMVEFAAAMIMQLQNFNRGSFQSFEGLNLRIGISHGEVAAGVVGSLKPLYDIWGHAVNMASRMDSTGETGKIQVTENTAIILDECDILTTYRGETFVKGAGYIKTYFVPLDENFNLIKKQQSMDYYRVQDRTRYFNIKNSLYNETFISNASFIDSESQASTYDVRTLSEDDSDSESYTRTITPTSRDDMSTSSESVRDTRC